MLGIVPISSGEGIISGFSQLLFEISDILLWAYDDTFLAKNIKQHFTSENGWATGLGFAVALDLLASIHRYEKKVVVLGAGPVGRSAAQYLTEKKLFHNSM